MSTEWYLIGNMPVYNSGFEKDEFDMYAKDSFLEILETSPVSKLIQIISHDLKLIKEIKTVVLNNVADSTVKSTERQLLTTIGTLQCGDYIKYENMIWMVTSFVGNNGIYEKAIVELINWILLFQSTDGTILSYPCIDSNPYNRGGEKEGTVITLGNTEKSISLPCDQNTILLRNGRRFFIDKHPTEPKSYEVIGVNTTSKNYGSKGLIELTVKETTMQEDDKVDLGICNYFKPTTPILPPESDKYSIIASSNANNQITIGSTSGRTLTPKFYKYDVEITDIVAVWTYELPVGFENQFTVTQVIGTNKLKIVVKDNMSLIGKKVVATVCDELGEYKSSITLTVVSGFY